MKKSLFLLVWLAATVAQAQGNTRQALVGTDGIDLLIEGPNQVDRGATVRWLVQSLEVVGLRDLRVAPGTKVIAAASHKPNDPIEVTTDGQGRAIITLQVSEDAPQAFTVSLDATYGTRAARHFDLPVSVRDPRSAEVHVPSEVALGGGVPVIGRLINSTTGRPLADQTVTLLLRGVASWGPATRSIVPNRQATTLSRRITLHTDRAGVVTHTFKLPRSFEGLFIVQMWSAENAIHEKVLGEASGRTVRPVHDSLVVSAAATVGVASPNSEVPIAVVVRAPDGTPIAGAQVYFEGIDPADTRGESRRNGQLARSNAQGQATLRWHAPAAAQPWIDASTAVVATELGAQGTSRTGRTDLHIRVVTRPWFAEVAAENGALPSTRGLSAQAYVRVVDGEGKPIASGHRVALRGPRIAAQSISPDSNGAGTVNFVLQPMIDDDACGGARATLVEILVDDSLAGSQCLAVDPDAVLALRTASSGSVTIEQAPSIANRSMSLSVFFPVGAASPVSRGLLRGGTTSAPVELPINATGVALIRLRPIDPNTGEETAGVHLLMPLQAPVSRLPARYNDGSRGLVLPSIEGATQVAVALPTLAHGEASELWLGWDLRNVRTQVDPSSLANRLALAKVTPRDLATAAILRDGTRVSIAMPTNDTANAILRDPWRIRDRFVEGRLAMVFGALEAFIASRQPNDLDEVAPRDANGRRRFRRELLSTLLNESEELAARTLESLGGAPLTIADLERLDPAFTFNAVARRVTRGRLLRVLIALRSFVKERGFDLSWTRRGDPNEWLTALVENENSDASLNSLDLVDAWGQPLKLIPNTRPRSQLAPVSGYELISSGPDLRYGTSDDIADPSRSMLATGLYADAVREPQLVARLRSTELSRATLLALGPALFGQDEADINEDNIAEPDFTAVVLPTQRAATRNPLDAQIIGDHSESELKRQELRFSLGEATTWTLVAASFGIDGQVQVEALDAPPTSGLAITVAAPDRLHPGAAATGHLTVTNLRNMSQHPSLVFTTPSELTITQQALPSLEAGMSATVPLTFVASKPGSYRWTVSSNGTLDAVSASGSIEVLADLHPQRTMQTLLLDEDGRLGVDLPSSAEAIQTRLTLIAPQALAQDPLLADFMQRDPACVLWAHATGTRQLPASWLWSTMRKFNGMLVEGERGQDALSSVCALVAFAQSDDDDVKLARDELGRGLQQLAGQFSGARGLSTAILTALGPAMSSTAADSSSDATVAAATRLVAEVRRSLHSIKNDPSLLARSAAALLLLDAEDLGGQKMYELAKAQVESAPMGKHLVPARLYASEAEDLTGTLALAAAAHAMHDETLARDLFRYAAGRSAAIAQLGGETLFWWLASGVYGAAGQAPTAVDAGQDPGWQWNGLSAAIPLATRTDARVRLEGGSLLARLESTYGTQVQAQDGPFTFALRGDAGRTQGRAGFELEVTSSEVSSAPIVDIALPSNVEATDELITLMTATGLVYNAELRRPGMLQLRLVPMTEGQSVRLALPLRWRSEANLDGLTVIGFDAASPWKRTVWRSAPIRVGARESPTRPGATLP